MCRMLTGKIYDRWDHTYELPLPLMMTSHLRSHLTLRWTWGSCFGQFVGAPFLTGNGAYAQPQPQILQEPSTESDAHHLTTPDYTSFAQCSTILNYTWNSFDSDVIRVWSKIGPNKIVQSSLWQDLTECSGTSLVMIVKLRWRSVDWGLGHPRHRTMKTLTLKTHPQVRSKTSEGS